RIALFSLPPMPFGDLASQARQTGGMDFQSVLSLKYERAVFGSPFFRCRPCLLVIWRRKRARRAAWTSNQSCHWNTKGRSSDRPFSLPPMPLGTAGAISSLAGIGLKKYCLFLKQR
ncbi:hypothetical protein ACQZ63_03860, partial [Agrobacterium sp. CG160-95]